MNHREQDHERDATPEEEALVKAFLAPLDKLDPATLPDRPQPATPPKRANRRRMMLRRPTIAIPLAFAVAGSAFAVTRIIQSTVTVQSNGNRKVQRPHSVSWAECHGIQGTQATDAATVLTGHGYRITWRATDAKNFTRAVTEPPAKSVVYSILQADLNVNEVIVDTRQPSDPEAKNPPKPNC